MAAQAWTIEELNELGYFDFEEEVDRRSSS
jgi:hypothetical protein